MKRQIKMEDDCNMIKNDGVVKNSNVVNQYLIVTFFWLIIQKLAGSGNMHRLMVLEGF